MTTPRRRLIDTAYQANELVQSTNIVGTVEGVNPPTTPEGQPTYTVRIQDRRNEDYGQRDLTDTSTDPRGAPKGGYKLENVASAVPVQNGHRVFVTIVNGSIRQGAYITGTVEPPHTQDIVIGDRNSQYMGEWNVTGPSTDSNPDAGLTENDKPWFRNSLRDLQVTGNVISYYSSAGFGNARNAVLSGLVGTLTDVTLPDERSRREALDDQLSNTRLYPNAFLITERDDNRQSAPALLRPLSDTALYNSALHTEGFRRIPSTQKEFHISSLEMDVFYTFSINQINGWSWRQTSGLPLQYPRDILAVMNLTMFLEFGNQKIYFTFDGGVDEDERHDTVRQIDFTIPSAFYLEGSTPEIRGYNLRGELVFHNLNQQQFTGTARLSLPAHGTSAILGALGKDHEINVYASIELVSPDPGTSFGVLGSTFQMNGGWSLNIRELGVGSALPAGQA